MSVCLDLGIHMPLIDVYSVSHIKFSFLTALETVALSVTTNRDCIISRFYSNHAHTNFAIIKLDISVIGLTLKTRSQNDAWFKPIFVFTKSSKAKTEQISIIGA